MTAPLLVIGGPTASGKSALAMEVARRVGAEIVSADSVQIYRRLDVGSAKPSRLERAEIHHHLIDVIEPGERYSAARYVADADAAIADAATRGPVVVVGGTGLYLRSLLYGLFDVTVPESVRDRVRAEAEALGAEVMHRRLAEVDVEAARRLPASDRVRVCRALEVFEATGVAISEHQRRHGLRERRHAHHAVTVTCPPGVLVRRIAVRSAAMVQAGLVAEVEGLLGGGVAPDAPALQTVGYREAIAVLQGRAARADLADAIAQATRQLAKRQRTWFRGQWTSREVSTDGSAQESVVRALSEMLLATVATAGRLETQEPGR